MSFKRKDTVSSIPFLKDHKPDTLTVKATLSVTFECQSGIMGRIDTQASQDVAFTELKNVEKQDQAEVLNSLAKKVLGEVLQDYLTPERHRQIKRISSRIAEELDDASNVTIIHWRYQPSCCDLCYFCEKDEKDYTPLMTCLLKDAVIAEKNRSLEQWMVTTNGQTNGFKSSGDFPPAGPCMKYLQFLGYWHGLMDLAS